MSHQQYRHAILSMAHQAQEGEDISARVRAVANAAHITPGTVLHQVLEALEDITP